MTTLDSRFDVTRVMSSVIEQTCLYFRDEFGLVITKTSCNTGALDSLTLLDMTAIIGIGGYVNLLVAFSFDYSQINLLFKRMTADIEIRPEEEHMMREAVAGEIANTVLGHCTADFPQLNGHLVTLTPPIVIERVSHIHRMKSAIFYTQSMKTELGRMDINLVGPCKAFSSKLECLD